MVRDVELGTLCSDSHWTRYPVCSHAFRHFLVRSLNSKPKELRQREAATCLGNFLGSAVGYWATTRSTPLSVQFLPRGLSVGYYKRF
jgi:hypothetical protein